jgi:DNA-directed RNA polymerase specialized sigma24 family protein
LEVRLMSSSGSITYWVDRLKGGDRLAAQKLWDCYFQQLVRLARNKLQGLPRRAADEEDVALSAFNSFWQGAEQGRFPQLADREDLWQLLVVIAARKAIDLKQHESRQKRGGGLPRADGAADLPALEEVVSREPTPEFAALVAEEYQVLFDRLTDPALRSIAVWKMEGYSTEQIAARLNCVPRTVERKLRLIRSHWVQEPPHG